MHSGGFCLEFQCFDIMRGSHQVSFRRKFVGRMTPVSIVERAKLTAVNKGFNPLLDFLEIYSPSPRSIADIICQGGCFCRIGAERAYYIDPIKRVEMIKMNYVVVLELCAMKKVSYDTCVFGNFDFYCIFDCPHRGQSMCVRSDPAGALNKMLGIAGVTALENHFNTSEHLA
jgi:hypothetical protein